MDKNKKLNFLLLFSVLILSNFTFYIFGQGIIIQDQPVRTGIIPPKEGKLKFPGMADNSGNQNMPIYKANSVKQILSEK